MEIAPLQTLVALGLAWMALKGLVTILLLLGAGRALRHTRLAPFVARVEAHLPTEELQSRLATLVRLSRTRAVRWK